MFTLNFTDSTITVSKDRPLTELSFGLKAYIEFFIGSGCWQFEFGRYKLDNKDCKVVVHPLHPLGALRVSSVTQVGGLVQAGLIPRSLTPWDLNTQYAADGPHRVNKEGNEGTIINIPHIRPEIPLASISFALSDQIVGFFWKGARTVRYQLSLKLAQVWFGYGMSNKELTKFAREQYDESIPDYNEKSLIGDLHRRFALKRYIGHELSCLVRSERRLHRPGLAACPARQSSR
jgi:hypothetical protein